MAAASTASIAVTTTTDPTGRILVSASPSSAPASALASSLRDLPPSASPQNTAIHSSLSAATTSLTGASANIAHGNSTSANTNNRTNTIIDNNSSTNRNGSGDGSGIQGSVSSNVGTTPDYGAGTASPNPDLRLYPRDGRVRNPVPSKLKGVTEEMRGNFSVMHMDVTSHRESQDRDAAAKLTSESTARQAKLAQTDTYISHHRRANYPRPAGLKQFASSSSSRKSRSTPTPDTAAPKRPLTVAETKAEQARLLTLLRTLPPPTIVDQICKALAFFGGIPDAPPPTDGKFPESAEANGSGSLFVGWFAEIFPDLDNPRRPALPDALQKRRRGRPKGSKASKVRSDKGIKKGRQKPTSSIASAAAAPEAADDGWVDVEDSTLDFNGEGDLVEVSAASRAPLSTPSRGPDRGVVDTTPATGSSTAGFRSINNEQAASAGSGAKRRGRPKGSKNRPKDAVTSQPADQAAAATTATGAVSQPAVSAAPAPPKVTPVPVPIPALGSQPKKANTGRPKGSKNRLKQGAGGTTTVQPPTESRQQSSDVSGRQDNHASGQVRKAGPSSLANRASSTVNGASGVQPPAQPRTTSGVGITTPLVKESTIVGVKRKRQGGKASNASIAKEKDTSAAAAGGSSLVPEQGQIHHPINTQSPTISQIQPQGANGASQRSASVASVDTATPATKRARKSKETSSAQAARRQTPNNPATKDTIPPVETTRQATQPTAVSQSRPPAEGLEAHYERMAAVQSRTDQGQGYTTNRSQRQPQQSPLSVGAAVSQPQAEGLEAHYERFAALQTHRQDSTRQPTTSRPQNPPQTVSPPLQTAKSSQLPVSLTSQPQTRASQSYYTQPQPLGSTYSATTQATFAPNQRQQQPQQQPQPQQLHVNSPQYGTQSNSPLLQSDSSYRASPTTTHNSASFVPRRTPSASPLDTSNYRSNGTTSQTLQSQATHFGSRHSAVTTTHGASHPSLQSSFQAFSADPAFLDIQGLDSANSHGGMGLGANPYGLGSNTGHPQQQRTSNAAAAPPVYSQASGLSNYLGSSSVGRAGRSQWPS
ncbi:hypothetical protein SLS62_000224 [Diatrype stigma]|uniref:Uncharacterized protein n=1 Tax=Diatrype stigma TaxID=117547 RepID=A0AAN9V246_9PEZI